MDMNMDIDTAFVSLLEFQATPWIDTVRLHFFNYSSAVDGRMTGVVIP